jgi:hypothetical protein
LNQAMTEQQEQVLQQMQNAEAQISKLPLQEQAQARQELQTMEKLLGSPFPSGGAGGPGKG